jgi:hypothetical protein
VNVRDVEAIVYDYVTSYVKGKYPALENTISAMEDIPTEFPCLYLRQTGSYDVYGSMTSFHDRDLQRVTFTADSFSQATSGRKREAKRISRLVALAFKKLGFTSTQGTQGPRDIQDETGRVTSWISGTYEAVFDPSDGTFCTY